MPRFAVVLCGCGRADGSEIHESVSCLIHLSRLGAQYKCFAPDAPQAEVVNHLTGKTAAESRNMLVESARIARGDIAPLADLKPDQFDGIVFPGGFGAAKNLCTFARDGESCTVHPDVDRLVNAFHSAAKPVAMCCIAPVIGAKVLGKAGCSPRVRLTVGQPGPAANAVVNMGAVHEPRRVTEACIDETHLFASAPAYMDDHANPWQVYEGIGRMIEAAVGMASRKPAVSRA